MKKLFFILTLIISVVSCKAPEPPIPDDGENTEVPVPDSSDENEEQVQQRISINVHEDKLAAFSVTFDVVPDDKNAIYYYDIISKQRLSEVDINTVKAELMEVAEMKAEMYGTAVQDELAQLLYVGDRLDVLSNAGYRPEVDFCIYSFYWDATTAEEISICEFRTPAKKESKESVSMSATSTPYSLIVDVQPSSGVVEYWYYIAERTAAEAMLAGLEDENAYMSYHAMNVGSRKEGAMQSEHKGLKPSTEYMVIIMGIDNELNRFVVSEIFSTIDEQEQEPVESVLFEKLLGEWKGTQRITDFYAEPIDNEFTVNILPGVEGVDYDYRAMNQLVATVDGWCNIAYYDIESLIAEGIEDAEDKWGPKWVFNIADGDVVTMDGKAQRSVVGWMFFGDCFMLNTGTDGSINTDTDLVVTVSEDYNTITISSPDSMPDSYPGLGYEFEGFGWMSFYGGLTDIVLKRK